MKTIPHIFLLYALLACLFPFSSAEARRTRGTAMTGLVKSIDHESWRIVFSQDGGPVRQFVYTRWATYWQDRSETPISLLSAGTRIRTTLHNPLFGPDFVTRIVLLNQRG